METAVITGAGQGLGRAIANRLHQDGWSIIAVDKNPETVNRTASEVGGLAIVCDVSDRQAVMDMGTEVAEHSQDVAALVNNAGIWRYSGLLDMTEQDAREVLDTNLLGTIWCSQAIVPLMQSHGRGAIVNFSSVASIMSAAGVGIYPASKSAIETITRQTALEFAPDGIRANAVAPGMIVTESTAPNYEGEMRTIRSQMIPMREVGEPEVIADVVSFLVSNDSRYVSGQLMAIDGAMSCGQAATAPVALGPPKDDS